MKLFFEDEARFGRICQPVRCWSPKGVRPVAPKQMIREFLYVYTAACPADGESFSLILPEVNGDSMSMFLEEFSKQYTKYRVVMVMDGAGWHKTDKLILPNNIKIIDLPSYSPELNPIEHIWEYIRENYFRNQIWNTLGEMEDELFLSIREVAADKITLQSLIGFHWAIFDF